MKKRQQMIDANDVIRYLEAKKGAVYVMRQDVINYVKALAEENGTALKYLKEMLNMGYNQKEISELTGVSQGTISAIARGATPSDKIVNALIEASML